MRKVALVVKGRARPYITNEVPSGGSIRTYLQRWELNINDSVRKYYNRSDYLTGSRSNSKNTKLPAVRNRRKSTLYNGCTYRNSKANVCSYVYIEVKASIL